MKQVTLIGPAKVGGVRKRVGATVEVDDGTLRQLVAAGAVAPEAGSDPDGTRVVLEGTDVRAVTQAGFDTAALEASEAEKNAALACAAAAEAQRDMLQERVLELQAQLAASDDPAPDAQAKAAARSPAPEAPQKNTPPPAAAKTARKGAAAKKG